MEQISIIVVNWNGERLLADCLESLEQQTYQEREIIVVDNGSTDLSVQFVKANFPNVKIVKLAENKGFAGGNLEGLKVAQGDFIALINNDTRADERWLESSLQPMLEDDKVGICASKLIIDGVNKINSAGGAITTAGVGFDRGLGADVSLYDAREPVFGACGAAGLYRRKMLDDIGFLDEDFFLYCEDTDLSFRAQLAGWKCIYVPKAIVFHKHHATSGKLSNLHVYHHTRNLEFVWVKNMPMALMLRYAHHKMIQELGAFCYLCLRRMQWKAFFKAKKDAFLMLPSMLKKRREIQKMKTVPNSYVQEMLTPIFAMELVRRKIRQFVWGRC